MALLTIQPVPLTGVALTFGAVSASDTVAIPDDRCFLYVKNASGGSVNVTLVTPGVYLGVFAIADPAQAVGAGTERTFLLSPAAYQDPATGLVTIQYSATTSITAAVGRI